MSKKKKNQEEPWSRRFGEDENYQGQQYSRSARKSTKKEVAPLSKVLLFLFLALLIIPFATYYWHEQTKANPDPSTPDQVMINKQNSSSAQEDEVESNVADNQESRREESTADASSVASTDESESIASMDEEESSQESIVQEESSDESSQEVVETPETDQTEDTGEYANTYTVQAGDNLYRIALNHGMDLEELKTVNGLTSDVAVIGQVLKVR